MKFRLHFKVYQFLLLSILISLPVYSGSDIPKKNILITAFGPYGGMDKNPSEMILNIMKENENLSKKIDFTFQLLRVVYGDVDKFISETDFSKYDMIVMMGLNPDSKKIMIETVGINLSDDTKDIDSIPRPGYIINRGPVRIRMQEKYIKKIQKYVKKKKQPFIFSEFDGNYVCNYLNYLTRYTIQKMDAEKPVIFLHVANSIDYDTAPRNEDQAEYILDLIEHLVK